MQLRLRPTRSDSPLELTKKGDTLTDGNGLTLDFGQLPNGATLPRGAVDCPWIAGDVVRSDSGVLTVPVTLPHGSNAPEETRFPQGIDNVPDGRVSLPPYDTNPEPEDEA